MSILSNIEEGKNKKAAQEAENANEKALMEAVKVYKKQKDSIYGIKDTEGLRQIRMFFERQRGICEQVFRVGSKPEYNAFMQGKYGLSRDFLDFLDNLMRTPPSDL